MNFAFKSILKPRKFANFLKHTNFTSNSKTMASSTKDYVDGLIKSKPVVVFSKTYCPYCVKAKKALDNFKLAPEKIEVIELDQRDDFDAIQDYLKEVTGQRSVPRVFIGGNFFGGGDDTAAALGKGTLEKELKAAGAIA